VHGPPLVAWLLVALSVAAAVACLLRDRARDEALMGIGMAVMSVPLSSLHPRPWVVPVLAAVYATAALRALLPGGPGGSHRAHHVVCSAAMVYMAVATAPAGPEEPPGARHMSTGTPLLTGLLLVYFAGYVLRTGIRLMAAPAHPAAARPEGATGPVRLRSVPEVAVACRVSMALGMLAMLLLM